jgi:hypothetical protein
MVDSITVVGFMVGGFMAGVRDRERERAHGEKGSQRIQGSDCFILTFMRTRFLKHCINPF